MVLPAEIDLAVAMERLVPQAAYGTARKTDIDIDDYAALERTYYDLRPLPSRAALIVAFRAYEAETTAHALAKQERRDTILLRRELAVLPEIGEIQSIASLVDAKQVMLKMRHNLAYFQAVLLALQIDEGLFE